MFMTRPRIFIAAAIALSVVVGTPVAQAQAPVTGTDAPKPSRLKLTKDHIKEMLAKWRANRPKLKACRTEARKQGLDGDDRWFFLEDCMDKS
jgi:hypothetical protein